MGRRRAAIVPNLLIGPPYILEVYFRLDLSVGGSQLKMGPVKMTEFNGESPAVPRSGDLSKTGDFHELFATARC